MKTAIKKIIASILYLNDHNEINDEDSIFKTLGLSSIDYVDLCFELKEKINASVTLENLWPFNKMLLNNSLYENSTWTTAGWLQVCHIMGWQAEKERISLQELYDYFTVNYIEKRLLQLASAKRDQ